MKPKFKLGQEVFTYSSTYQVISWNKCPICNGSGQIQYLDKPFDCPQPGCSHGKCLVFGHKVISPGKITDIRETKQTHLSGSGRISKHTQIEYLCEYGEILANPIDEAKLFTTIEEAQAVCDQLNHEKK